MADDGTIMATRGIGGTGLYTALAGRYFAGAAGTLSTGYHYSVVLDCPVSRTVILS